MPQSFSSDTILVDNSASSGLLPVHLLRYRPAEARAAVALCVLLILALAIVDWRIESLQMSILALVPVAVFAWFVDKRAAYAVAFIMAMVFTYFDYSGPQAVLVNLPLDTAFTVVSYVARE